MKPRHAAALALVGWYLLIPPLARSVPPQQSASAASAPWLYLNETAPLKDWRFALPGHFNTERECLEKLSGWREDYDLDPGENNVGRRRAELAQIYSDYLRTRVVGR